MTHKFYLCPLNGLNNTIKRQIGTPFHSSRIHIHFKYTGNIHQDRHCEAIKQISINLKGYKSYKMCSLSTNE